MCVLTWAYFVLASARLWLEQDAGVDDFDPMATVITVVVHFQGTPTTRCMIIIIARWASVHCSI